MSSYLSSQNPSQPRDWERESHIYYLAYILLIYPELTPYYTLLLCSAMLADVLLSYVHILLAPMCSLLMYLYIGPVY